MLEFLKKIRKLIVILLEKIGIIGKTNSGVDDNGTPDDTSDDVKWYEYAIFNEELIEKLKDVFRPIIKKYYDGEGKDEYYAFMDGLVKHIKVYCTVDEDGKLLSFKFTLMDDYNKDLHEFVKQFIVKDFYAIIENTALGNIPLSLNINDGVIEVRLVRFLGSNGEDLVAELDEEESETIEETVTE
jgi:hypothetical protein